MAVSEGAGPLQVGKPITVNDMMEAIQLPGLKPLNGQYVDLNGDVTGEGNTSGENICQIGRAGYTEVLDDIIVEVTTVGEGGDTTIKMDVGFKADNAGVDTTRFLSGVTVASTGAVGVYSVLRGSFDWDADALTEALRTFTPGNGGSITFDFTPSGATTGTVRVYARTHYTAVNFGPGL